MELKEELTTKMHSEFSVSVETDIKHRVFSLLTLTGVKNEDSIKKWLSNYDVTLEQVQKYMTEYKSLL